MSTGEDPNVMVISVKDVYLEIVRLRDDMARMSPQITAVSDHEVRLRSLERWRYALPTSILLALGSLAVAGAEFLSHR